MPANNSGNRIDFSRHKRRIALLMLLVFVSVGIGIVVYPVIENRHRVSTLISHFDSVGGAARTEMLTNDDGISESIGRWLPILARRKIVKVNLARCSLDTSVLESLQECLYLEDLDLSETNIEDDDLRILRDATRLIRIDLSRTNVGDEAIHWLSSRAPLLRVNLSDTNVTDRVAMSIKRYSLLNTLNVSGTGITDQFLKELTQAQSLQVLFLNETRITPSGIQAISRHPRGIVEIAVSGDTWNDDTISVFSSVTTLETLLLYNTGTTEDGVNDLTKALPNCHVVRFSD